MCCLGDACVCDAACPGCNLIGCSVQSFGAGGKKTCVKYCTIDRTVILTKKGGYFAGCMVTRKTPANVCTVADVAED